MKFSKYTAQYYNFSISIYMTFFEYRDSNKYFFDCIFFEYFVLLIVVTQYFFHVIFSYINFIFKYFMLKFMIKINYLIFKI